jgi:predicted Zn-dependent protease
LAQATREEVALARSGQRTLTAVREHSQAFVRVETPRGALLDSVAASGDGAWEPLPVVARIEEALAAVAGDAERGVAADPSLPHVLRPSVAAPLVSALAFILRADVGLAQPALARAVGKRVFPACLTVTDSGGPGGDAPPFDDEGFPIRPLTLVDAGVLTTFLHTSVTAASGASNGRAQRVGDSGQPVPGTYSLGIAPGNGDLPPDCNEWSARLEGFTVMPKVGHVRVIAAGWERRGGQRVRRLAPVELELPVLGSLRRLVSVGRDVATFPALEHVRCPTLVLTPG